MTAQRKRDFGKRARPKAVGRKPDASDAMTRKRSLAISVALMGALSLGTYEAIGWLDRKLNCEPDPARPDELICQQRGGGGYWASGGGGSHGVSFGGFGHSGSGGG